MQEIEKYADCFHALAILTWTCSTIFVTCKLELELKGTEKKISKTDVSFPCYIKLSQNFYKYLSSINIIRQLYKISFMTLKSILKFHIYINLSAYIFYQYGPDVTLFSRKNHMLQISN